MTGLSEEGGRKREARLESGGNRQGGPGWLSWLNSLISAQVLIAGL